MSEEPLSIADYPLAEKRPEIVRGKRGKGLDEITGGGLPQGRPTLVCGSAGCGKTLLAAEFLMRGALEFNEPRQDDTHNAAGFAGTNHIHVQS